MRARLTSHVLPWRCLVFLVIAESACTESNASSRIGPSPARATDDAVGVAAVFSSGQNQATTCWQARPHAG